MSLGRSLIFFGLILIVVGALVSVGGKLPGDIRWRGKNTTFYFPIVSCILLSVILSLILSFFRKP